MNCPLGAQDAGTLRFGGEHGGMLHASVLGASLAAFWLLLSGYFTEPLLLSLGAVSVIATVYLALRTDKFDGERVSLRIDLPIIRYWVWLLVEIVKANIDVAKLILSPTMALSPRMVRVKATQATDVGVVIYANSITLTPGTVTIDIDDDEFVVHAITQEMADGLTGGDMGDRVTALGAR
jgi:multicomponent Na+:H+ antiporter subunit E